MTETHERVLAIALGNDLVRGVVLKQGPLAEADGYAQLGYENGEAAAAVAARIARALDVRTALPVVLTIVDGVADSVRDDVAAAIANAGFAIAFVEQASTSAHRSNPEGRQDPDSLEGASIAEGLLTSHEGLRLVDLAPVVGAALGLLGEPSLPTTPAASAPPAPAAPVATAADPFSPSTVDPVVAEAAATPSIDDLVDEDLTMPASASMLDELKAKAVEAAQQAEPGAEPAEPLPDDVTVASAGLSATPAPEVETIADDVTVASAGVASAAPAAAPPAAHDMFAGAEAFGSDGNDTEMDFGGKRSLNPLMLALGALILIGVIGFVMTQCGGDETEEPEADPAARSAVVDDTEEQSDSDEQAQVASQQEASAAQAEPTQAPEPTEVPEPTATPEPTVAPTAEPTPTPEPTADPLEGLPPLSSLPERGAIFRPPTLFLEGPVQTQEQADALYNAAIAVVGPDNVVNNYVVRPDAPASLDGNVRVEQAVLFQTASATISEQFVPTLELGVAVMSLNPQVQMVVEGHTDSIGSEASNQLLSQRRAEAVVGYLIGRGIDGARLSAVGMGELSPVASNDTDEGRQLNRRIEVELLDLLAQG